MTLITTTLTALMLVSSLSVTNSATTATPVSCIITLDPGILDIPIGEARSVTYNKGKDYVMYNCTDPTVSTSGNAYVCESAKCAYRTGIDSINSTVLHSCQDCLLLYNAVFNCIDTDGADCTDTNMCTNNPDEGTANCCGTCKDYLSITTTPTPTPNTTTTTTTATP